VNSAWVRLYNKFISLFSKSQSQFNSFHTLMPYTSIIHFNIILIPMQGLPHAYYTSQQPHSSWVITNNIRIRTWIMKLLTMQFSLLLRYLHLLSSKYSPEHLFFDIFDQCLFHTMTYYITATTNNTYNFIICK
jgi:hypothetical protein